jgi:hypothetical protein
VFGGDRRLCRMHSIVPYTKAEKNLVATVLILSGTTLDRYALSATGQAGYPQKDHLDRVRSG